MKNEGVNLSILKTGDTQLSENIIDKKIAEKFSFGICNLEVSKVEDFIKRIKKDFPNLEISRFKFSTKGNSSFYIEKKESSEKVSEDISDLFIFINQWEEEKSYVEIYGRKAKEVESFYNRYIDFFMSNEEYAIRFVSFYTGGKGLEFDTDFVHLKDLEDISEDYYPDITDINGFFETFFNSKESIVVLSGLSGVGKSKFATLALKYIIEHGEQFKSEEGSFDDDLTIPVAYVKNERILATDAFWINLKKFGFVLVILDDLDYFLSPRQRTVDSELDELKNQFVSHLLSFTDGIIKTRTKFIITSNREIDSVDSALLRDGRMLGVYQFRKLTRKEALKIWKNSGLEESDFKKEFGDKKEILQAEIGSKIHIYKNNNGKDIKSFIKEESDMDVSSGYKRNKKTGFV